MTTGRTEPGTHVGEKIREQVHPIVPGKLYNEVSTQAVLKPNSSHLTAAWKRGLEMFVLHDGVVVQVWQAIQIQCLRRK